MFEQTIVVGLLVIGCTACAAWTLMPSAARRVVAQALLKWPLPQRAAAMLQKQLAPQSGCACDGCDKGTRKREPSGLQQIRIHPRIKR